MYATELVVPAATLAVIVGALLKIILWQNEKSMNFRFKQLEDARAKSDVDWNLRYQQMQQELHLLTERHITVEANLEHMPTHFEIQKINTDLSHLQGETNTQTALLQRMEQQMRRINDWMMENK